MTDPSDEMADRDALYDFYARVEDFIEVANKFADAVDDYPATDESRRAVHHAVEELPAIANDLQQQADRAEAEHDDQQ